MLSGEEGAMEEILGAYADGRLSGEDVEYLGAFLPGLKKFFKKVGKVTSKITTAAARFVGVPKSALDALAKIDPTKRGSMIDKAIAAAQAMPSTPSQQVVPVPASAMGFDMKKMLIIGGAGFGGLVLIGILAGAMKRRA
jgi:alkanesulfonate monooxygenase SsuD/methylene tetrahydromethanopterin reductase-like flavin-dependent oxidoreductase (luciferase family)